MTIRFVPSGLTRRTFAQFVIFFSLFVVVAQRAQAAEIPPAKAAGAGGGPASILFLADSGALQREQGKFLDEQYQKEMTDAGYRVTQVKLSQKLSADYLNHFG